MFYVLTQRSIKARAIPDASSSGQPTCVRGRSADRSPGNQWPSALRSPFWQHTPASALKS
jgi:hypothetical protein